MTQEIEIKKVFTVIYLSSTRDVDCRELLGIFSTEKKANDFHENIPIKKRQYCFVDDEEVQ